MGTAAFDNPETANIRDYTKGLSPKPELGHSIHSYGQTVLIPWGYEVGVGQESHCPNFDDMVRFLLMCILI